MPMSGLKLRLIVPKIDFKIASHLKCTGPFHDARIICWYKSSKRPPSSRDLWIEMSLEGRLLSYKDKFHRRNARFEVNGWASCSFFWNVRRSDYRRTSACYVQTRGKGRGSRI